MTFLEQLTAHKGQLIKLKSKLFWYETRNFDNVIDRTCLLVDAATCTNTPAATITVTGIDPPVGSVAAVLMINEQLQWVWVDEKCVEFIF